MSEGKKRKLNHLKMNTKPYDLIWKSALSTGGQLASDSDLDGTIVYSSLLSKNKLSCNNIFPHSELSS